MAFRKCTIGGNAYRGDIKPSHDEEEKTGSEALPSTEISVDQDTEETSTRNTPPDPTIEKFRDLALQLDIKEAIHDRQDSPSDFSTTLIGFFTVLSLCHSVLAAKDPMTGKLKYKAQSPDEAALVQAAADMGFEFLGKDRENLSLKTPGSANIEKYELLDILEFTSARKRMSVVVRTHDGSLLLLTKGADNIIFDRLRPGAEAIKRDTERHLTEFANSGLRTLTLAYKTIPGSSRF